MLIFKEKALKERELCHTPRGNVHPSPLKEKARLGAGQQSDQDKKKKNDNPGQTVQKRENQRRRSLSASTKRKYIFKGMALLHGCSEECTK